MRPAFRQLRPLTFSAALRLRLRLLALGCSDGSLRFLATAIGHLVSSRCGDRKLASAGMWFFEVLQESEQAET
jgi:hypothetical protein